jgi:hypothetical protein
LEERQNQKGMSIMKRRILVLFLVVSILLTACIKTPVDKKTGIKLNAVSAIDLSKYTNNEELDLSKSPTATFILTTDSVLTDFKIQNIAYDGIKCEVDEDLYSKKKFDTSMSITVKAYIPETFSNLLITYKKDGKIYRYYVNSNMTGEEADANLKQATM